MTHFHFCSITKPKFLQLPATVCPYARLSLITDSQSNDEYRWMSPSKKEDAEVFAEYHKLWPMLSTSDMGPHYAKCRLCGSSFYISHSGANDCASCGKECMKDLYWIFDFFYHCSYWYTNSGSVLQAFQNVPQIKVHGSWREDQGVGGSALIG